MADEAPEAKSAPALTRDDILRRIAEEEEAMDEAEQEGASGTFEVLGCMKAISALRRALDALPEVEGPPATAASRAPTK